MNDLPSPPVRPFRGPPFLTPGRLARAILLYIALALVPPSPLERPLFVVRLLTSPPPERVAVPVDGVRPSDLRGSWGGPRSGGRRHEGIDILAPRGTRVIAAVDGIVSRVASDRLGGLVVWQLGPGGHMHYYAHLDRQSGFRPGDRVFAGDTLGYVGTTGNARGGPPHLHYGIYTGGGAIDPFPLLTRAAPRPPEPAARAVDRPQVRPDDEPAQRRPRRPTTAPAERTEDATASLPPKRAATPSSGRPGADRPAHADARPVA